jgi:hypothetical protein
MDAFGCWPHSMALVRMLAHIKKLDDCFGDFLVPVSCQCGAVRQEGRGGRGRSEAQVAGYPEESALKRSKYRLTINDCRQAD